MEKFNVAKALKYRKSLRATDVVREDGRISKVKYQVIAEDLADHLKKQDLGRISHMLETDAFFDICDILRIMNAMEGSKKSYDDFPVDFHKICIAIKHIL